MTEKYIRVIINERLYLSFSDHFDGKVDNSISDDQNNRETDKNYIEPDTNVVEKKSYHLIINNYYLLLIIYKFYHI